MSKYTIGLDFGTLSGRAVLADVSDGKIIAASECLYPHGVMTDCLPDGTRLPQDWALQYPQDYLDAMAQIVPAIVREGNVQVQDIIGIGVDVTACTATPVDRDGVPLCMQAQWEHHPHAYVKLWKHHSAQKYADRITRVAEERNESWLRRYGGKVSSEWSLPKLWELLAEDPAVYDAMYEWIEAADWLIWQLTGNDTKNACAAGYKNFYSKSGGYPEEAFYAALDPQLRDVIAQKCFTRVSPAGSKAGHLRPEMARKLGLAPGIAVAAGNVDAHVCVPAAGITKPGQMLGILGTSACYMSLAEKEISVPGICGAVEDGLLPGFWGYEAGQSCVGDHFAWFCEHCVPAGYFHEAERSGMHIQQYLTSLAEKLRPGESGLLALDWWNGNRSVLVDADLTGLIIGMTLQTKPEEIYRALIEATAYGTRMIVENYREHGIPVDTFFATGGISQKNALAMQILADVLGMPVHVTDAEQGAALGSAISGAVAAGAKAGGYDSVIDAIHAMSDPVKAVYHPDARNVSVYSVLFSEYRRLHDYFGRGENDVMKRLKALKHSEHNGS